MSERESARRVPVSSLTIPALMAAIRTGDTSCYFYLYYLYAADINVIANDGKTPLILAAAGGHKAMVQQLISGSDRNLGPKVSLSLSLAATTTL